MGPTKAAIFNWIAWRTEKGSRTFFYASTQNTKPGAYISSCKETPPSLFVVSEKGKATQKKYWAESVAIWKSLVPGYQF
jgi:retinol dehydrogenase-12